ncbi:hypothetical protein V6N13_101620 [Hibiscus sabdariffa]
MTYSTLEVVAHERRVTGELGDLLRAEEKFLHQKSRARILAKGDQNTGFFFRQVAIRQKANTIKAVQDENGNWVDSYEGISSVFTQFFSNSLGVVDSSVQSVSDNFLRELLGVEFTAEMQNCLVAPITRQEIRDVIFGMDGNKAPGPDGYSARFFQFVMDIYLARGSYPFQVD